MRKYLHIDLRDRSIRTEELNGEAVIRVGRHFIAKTLLRLGAATVDPLSPENPLIFSAGPFAGTNFSNANRISVGCKSPLTGGIKEANSGGTFGFRAGPARNRRAHALRGVARVGRHPHHEGGRDHVRQRRALHGQGQQ